MTFRSAILDKRVRISSWIPSAKYAVALCCKRSGFLFFGRWLRTQKSKDHQTGRQGCEQDYQSGQLATCLTSDSAINLVFALDSLRRQVKRPGKDQSDGKPDHHRDNNHLDCPVRNFKKWEN